MYNKQTKHIYSKMESVPTKTFAKQISTVEYNNQKLDYTEKALKELQEQMKTFKRPSLKTNKVFIDKKDNNCNIEDSENSGNSEIEEVSDNEEKLIKAKSSEVNLIIKHVVDKNSKSNTKTNNNANTKPLDDSMINSIYAQHEIDIKIISNLNKLIMELKQKHKNSMREYDSLDKNMHYLKLDLGNAQLENKDLIKKIDLLEKETTEFENQIIKLNNANKNHILNLNIVKGIFLILLILNIYYGYFKYFLFVASIINIFI